MKNISFSETPSNKDIVAFPSSPSPFPLPSSFSRDPMKISHVLTTRIENDRGFLISNNVAPDIQGYERGRNAIAAARRRYRAGIANRKVLLRFATFPSRPRREVEVAPVHGQPGVIATYERERGTKKKKYRGKVRQPVGGEKAWKRRGSRRSRRRKEYTHGARAQERERESGLLLLFPLVSS